MLLLPSIRGLAYVNAFRDCRAFPGEVILMAGEIPRLAEVRAEGERFGYSQLFFDLTLDLYDFLKGCGARVTRVPTTDANSPIVHEALRGCRSS